MRENVRTSHQENMSFKVSQGKKDFTGLHQQGFPTQHSKNEKIYKNPQETQFKERAPP